METIVDKQKMVDAALKNPSLITRELNNRSLHHFLRWVWPEISGDPFIDNWHLRFLSKELEQVAWRVGHRMRKESDLLINIPPGTTKTRLCSIAFPVWCWTRWHWMRFITASYSSALALENAEHSRNIIRSYRFREVYPDLDIRADKDTKGNFQVVKKQASDISDYYTKSTMGGNRYSTSVGGTLTGFHADIFIWDDILNPKQALSEWQIELANKWIDETASTRKTDKMVSVMIGIMQRLHQMDPTNHLLEKKKKTTRHICLPGEITHYREYLKPQELEKEYVDGLLDRKRLNWEVLSELEADLGQYGFAGQIGQNPAPPGGGMFKVEGFQMTSELIPKKEYRKTVRYWDKAGTEKRRDSKFTVGVKMSRLRNGMFIIDDVKRGKWASNKREEIIRQTTIADGENVIVVVEQEPGSGGKESAEGTIRNLAGFHVEKDRPTGDKENRADPLSVQVNNGNVYLRVAEWNRDFKEEFSLFPRSTYKDQVDATSGAFGYLVKKKEVRRIT
jgi:predicted phage terminase large subunit-like protein